MSFYGSQKALNDNRRAGSRGDLTVGGTYQYGRNEAVHSGNGFRASEPYMDGYTYTFSKTSTGGGMGAGQGDSSLSAINQKAFILQGQCQDYLRKAELAMQSSSTSGDTERYMAMAKETMDQLRSCAVDLRQQGQPSDNVIRSVEMCRDQLKGVHLAFSGTMQRRSRGSRGSAGGWEEPGRAFTEAMAWIGQQKRLIETAPCGDDPAAIEQQLITHQKYHSTIQRSSVVDRARDDLMKKGDKASLHALDGEWDSLQKSSFNWMDQLRVLQQILEEISREIMWVNEREEEELVFDWGDKNIDQYIPKKQESYSKLMSVLEEKEKDLNKLKTKVDVILKNNHPAAGKIEAYMDTLQTQWSWLLQITKCIHVHLKENAAYSQFFRETNETYSALQNEHKAVRTKFQCDKNTSLEDLMEILKELEKEKDKITENKRQVQHLVSKSKSIVRLKPRNPEEKSSGVIVRALCDFRQDQKAICKDNEGILKDNSQRSKWQVTGPGGLDMLVPSVCLLVPPPNPISISQANKNEQYYDAILSIWNQLYINIKSLISWQYCLLDIQRINSLTISMLSRMHPEEYRNIIKSLEAHYGEFKLSCHGSQMFADEDKRSIESQYTGAQTHYDQLMVQMPSYTSQQQVEVQQVEAQQAQKVQQVQQAQQVQQVQQVQQIQHIQQVQQVQQPRQQVVFLQQQPEQQRQHLIFVQQQNTAVEDDARWREEQEALRRREEQEALRRREEQEALRCREEQEALHRREEQEALRLREEQEALRHREEVQVRSRKEQAVKTTKTEVVKKKVAMSSSAAPAYTSSSTTSSRSLMELHALRRRLEAAEGSLTRHIHICLGEDVVQDCSHRITELETLQHEIDCARQDYLSLKERILKELEGTADADKAMFLRSEIGTINNKLGSLESSSSAYLQRLQALRALLESVAQAEDIIKVHEARLTEKETTSLEPREVEEYTSILKNMKAELEQKRAVLVTMATDLDKANHWDSQVGESFHRCDMTLSKYSEHVEQLNDRWKRADHQIDSRLQELELYLPQLQNYKRSSVAISDWITTTRNRQDALQATSIADIKALNDHISQQKALNTEIKGKRETLEDALRDSDVCFTSIKDYESDLACYMSGLETLLNIPIKRTMLRSPSMELTQEATLLQTRYMELLTLSSDYYKYLGELLKNMEELKIRNTRISLLEDELQQLKEDVQGRMAKNSSLEEAIARYQLQLSTSQQQLLSVEEVKRNTAMQYSATKDSLNSTNSQLAELNGQVERLNYLLDEEKRKRRLAEERYAKQQEDYEAAMQKRQAELEQVSWAKVEVEKGVAEKEREAERLRRQLAQEESRAKELQLEMSKVRGQCSVEINKIKLSYESQMYASRTDIQRLEAKREEDATELRRQCDRMEAERMNLEEELSRLHMSVAQSEECRRRAEEEAHSQRSVVTEEGRRRRQLEDQLELLSQQREEENSQHMEELAQVTASLEEKIDLLAFVTHNLEEEARRRRTAEEGKAVLQQAREQLQAQLDGSSVAVAHLGQCEEDLLKMRLELERQGGERCRVEQTVVRLQGRIKDLQAVRDGLESQVEMLHDSNQEEVARRRRVEAELELSDATIREYSSTITTLRQSQEQASSSEKKVEEVQRRLQDELETSLKKNKASSEHLIQLTSDMKALQQQLIQEREHVKEANLHKESIYKTIEEKGRTLNESLFELQKLKELTETLNRERLRLDEELQAVKLKNEELLRSKQGSDEELASQMTALQLQLQSSNRTSLDYQNLVSELSSEREKLKLEIEQIKKQAMEATTLILSTQGQYSEMVRERDDLLLKLKLSDQDKERLQKLDEDLSRIKLTLETEQRNKQSLQEENERMKNDFAYWKKQYESKEGLLNKCDSDRDKLEHERNCLKSEIERLMRELKEVEEMYKSRLVAMQKELTETTTIRRTVETQMKTHTEPPTLDPSSLIFDGVRKPVTAQQLLDSGVLDRPTFNQLVKGQITVPEVSLDKKIILKGTGPIAAVVIEDHKGTVSVHEPIIKRSLREAKKEKLLPVDTADLLLDAQAATGHIIDPRTNQKLTVEQACDQGVVDEEDRERLEAAEAAAVGYRDPTTGQPISAFQAMKKGLIERNTALRLLQAQESVGGILDPILSVFLPKDIAMARHLIDDDIYRALNQRPELYLDPETNLGASYLSLKRRCKTEPHTSLLLLPVPKRLDPSKLLFEGVRKPVTAQQLLDCNVLDKPTFNQLVNGEKTVPEVSTDKRVSLKGTGPIAGVLTESQGKMSFAEAKKICLLPTYCANLLLDAQAATGHIIDPRTNQKFTVEEACARGLVDKEDKDQLLAAEAAAVGYNDPSTTKPLCVFEAMKRRLIDRKRAQILLQAQESVGGFLDPVLSVFLPIKTALERNLVDKDLSQSLSQIPECYVDPENEMGTSYASLKNRCKMEAQTGLLLLPISDKLDPSKLLFEGVRKPVTAQQLFDCGVLDKTTLNQLVKGEKTVADVSLDKKVYLKGTGSIGGVAAGFIKKMSFTEAKEGKTMSSDSAYLLLEAQAATGHIIDPRTNEKLTVADAYARGLIEKKDKERLMTAEAAAVGYQDPNTCKPLSAGQAMRKGLIDRDTALRMIQAQESAGGILDPVLSVFLPKDIAKNRDLIDEDLYRILNQSPECYLDPDTQQKCTYVSLKKKCKADLNTGLLLLPATEQPFTVQGLRDQVSVVDLVDANLLENFDVDQLRAGKITSQDIEDRLRSYLRGSTCIAGVYDEASNKIMAVYHAMKEGILRPGTTLELLEAQAASGFVVDPVNNLYLTVSDACKRGLVGPEFKDKVLAAESAVTGYKLPGTDTIISLFQAIDKGLVEKGHGIRLLEAQIASGGIIDPKHSHRIEVDIAYKRGYFNEELNRILRDEGDETKGFFDPNTQENLTYLELKRRCITDKKTGLVLFPIKDKKKQSEPEQQSEQQSSQKKALRKRRVVIVDPDTNKEMTVREAYEKGLIDHETFIQLSGQECEWEEVTVTAPDGSTRVVITDKKSGKQYDITELLQQGVINQSTYNQYRSHSITLTQFADIITNKSKSGWSSTSSASTGPSAHVATATSSGLSSVSSVSSKPLLQPEYEWEEVTVTAPVGSSRVVITDKKTGKQYDITELLQQGVIDQSTYNQYRSHRITLTQFADIITNKTKSGWPSTSSLSTGSSLHVGIGTSSVSSSMSSVSSKTSIQQECEWEEVTVTTPNGSSRVVITDKKAGKQYNITELLQQGAIDQSIYNQYRSGEITLTQFADTINKSGWFSTSPLAISPLANAKSFVSASMSTALTSPFSPTLSKMTTSKMTTITERSTNISHEPSTSADSLRHISSVSVNLSPLVESVGEQEPVGAIFDTENLQKLSILQAKKCGLVDSITAQRLLEAQACTGGIVNPTNGCRLGIHEASRQGIIDDDMATRLKPAQKAYVGYDDVKTKKKMSAAEAVKEKWLPYEAGQRFMEFQFMTGGLYDPELGCRRTIEDALKLGWLDGRTAQKLQDTKHHAKILTCPKSKLKISYKEAMDNCLVEENTGLRMLQASSVSSKGISSPYNFLSAPGSTTGSRSGSRTGSRRSSVDLGSPSSSGPSC